MSTMPNPNQNPATGGQPSDMPDIEAYPRPPADPRPAEPVDPAEPVRPPPLPPTLPPTPVFSRRGWDLSAFERLLREYSRQPRTTHS